LRRVTASPNPPYALHPLSRIIDDFDDVGVAISLKSIDLNAITYQDFGRLTSRLNKYIGDLEEYPGTDWGGDKIASSAIMGRTLHLIIPKSGTTALQRAAIEAAREKAKVWVSIL
jgi:hypothetical protein